MRDGNKSTLSIKIRKRKPFANWLREGMSITKNIGANQEN